MEKFIPYKKLSKKEKKKYDSQKRNLWKIKPTERIKQSDKKYSRRKIKAGRNHEDEPAFFILHFCC